MELPPVLVRNALGVWGADGRRWLDHLPRIVDAVARDWGLRVERPFELSHPAPPPADLKVSRGLWNGPAPAWGVSITPYLGQSFSSAGPVDLI